VGGVAPVLISRRVAGAAIAVPLAVYYAVRESLPNVGNDWDVALIALALMPAVFALVYLALPMRHAHGLLLVGVAFAVLAAILHAADQGEAASFAKLGATTAIGFWFLGFFETVGWVVLVALLIPWVDAYSVWRGPTRHIVDEQRDVFTALSFAFPVPGETASANLGVPDLLFFAVFLGAAARFRLRVGWTWLAMTGSFALTMALAVGFDVGGLPALPLLSLAFLAPNADLLWRELRRMRARAAMGERAGAASPPAREEEL
jgi:hypothetical protein